MKRVLITGATGYLGSVLCEVLAEAGHECLNYDTGFFRDCLLYQASEQKVKYLDVRAISEQHLQGVDVVVHLAGISNDPMGKLDASSVYDPTRLYTYSLASMCKKLGIGFVFASSCSVYGIGDGNKLSESDPTNPQTPYSLNKLQIETDLQSLSDSTFSPIALRFATVFGSSPRIRFDIVINMFVGMAVADNSIVLNSDGQSWRPNLHILDACRAIQRSVELDYSGGDLLVINVGSDENNLQIIDIARTVQSSVPGCQLRFLSEDPSLDRDGLIKDRKVSHAGSDTRTYQVSFDKIEHIFPGFKCEWSVEKGVKEMVERFLSLPLSHDLFKSKGFYRLQQLEFLLSNNYLSDDLIWQNHP